jgi:dUTP pyrophosphatase
MTVQVRRLRDVPLPKYQTDAAAGFDLSVADEVTFAPREFKLVPTGLALVTPPGHFLMLTPRSSLFKRHKLMLTNSPGIVDADYCGNDDEILLALYNPTPNTTTLMAKERVAQGVFVPYHEALWQEVDHLEAPSRGGYGSTGRV